MRRGNRERRGYGAVPGALSLVYVLASCAPRVEVAAPVVTGERVAQAPISMTVARGQTLSGIALTYHVSMRAIAEANGLSPPYRIQAGRNLIIPRGDRPYALAAPVPVSARDEPPPSVAILEPLASPGARQAEPVDRSVPTSPEKSPVLVAPSLRPALPSAGEVVSPNAKPSSGTPAAPKVQNTAPTEETRSGTSGPPTRISGAFLWPVRGHVVATYGSRSDGAHNDGINIAAPKGAAVEATEAGVVAYTGNELRGYGNLILVKHPNGWISAYAHCDQMLVQRGQKVARGQVIARVGSTGNVGEPQLHFELRRGNHPVDPREFLAPLPTAATKDSRSG